MEQRRIHIICLKSEICSLIKKTLMSSGYNVSCSQTLTDYVTPELSDEKVDCLILDSDIDAKTSEEIRERFKNAAIIYLPSLESEVSSADEGSKNISEPLKLSELSEAVKSVFYH